MDSFATEIQCEDVFFEDEEAELRRVLAAEAERVVMTREELLAERRAEAQEFDPEGFEFLAGVFAPLTREERDEAEAHFSADL